MMLSSRDDAERALARALSRHIGYTSGAYHLDRIFAVLEQFRGRTSAYKQELVSAIETMARDQKEKLSSDYAGEILNFAVAMGLLETVSARQAGLVRFAATETGRSLLGARAVGDESFFRFYMAKVVLLADADFLIPLLLFFKQDAVRDVLSYFAAFQRQLRAARLDWLIRIFPEPVLLERVVDHVGWIKRGGKDPLRRFSQAELKPDTVRHHAIPRQGWVEQLGLLDRRPRKLTSFGSDVLSSLAPNSQYFWVAPPTGVLEAMAITDRPQGMSEDKMQFTSFEKTPTAVEMNNLCESVRRIMIEGYDSAKLIHASQASLQLPLEYISYRRYRDQRRYDWESVIDTVFKESREQLQRYSAHKGKIGFYRVAADP